MHIIFSISWPKISSTEVGKIALLVFSAFCSVQCACSVQYPLCHVRCAVCHDCSVQCSVCTIRFTVCTMRFTACNRQCSVCAVCSVQCAVCSLQFAVQPSVVLWRSFVSAFPILAVTAPIIPVAKTIQVSRTHDGEPTIHL